MLVNGAIAGTTMCLVLGMIFALMGLVFAIGKEKAAILVAGFNSLSKEERDRYDTAYISRDMRNQCWLWTVILLAGAVLTYYVSPYMAVIAMIVWLYVFFKEMHVDTYTAFKKYLK